MQLGKLIKHSPAAFAAGSTVLSAVGWLAGPSVKEAAKGVARSMGVDEILIIGLTGLLFAAEMAEKRSRDQVWLRKMKNEALAIVEEAEHEHVF